MRRRHELMLRGMHRQPPQVVDVPADDGRESDLHSALQDGVLGGADDHRVAFAHGQTSHRPQRFVHFRFGRGGAFSVPRHQTTIFATAGNQGTVRFVNWKE